MAISKITYTNKQDLSTTSVADANKVKASDLNEIKTVVNNNADELTNATTWTLIGTTSGNTEISLPSGWTDLYACISLGTSTSLYHTVITNSVFVGTTNKQLRFGYYLTSTSRAGGSIYITDSGTKAKTLENFLDDSNVLTNTTTYWYYK